MQDVEKGAIKKEGSILLNTRYMDNYICELSDRLTELESEIADILCVQEEQAEPESGVPLSPPRNISNLGDTLKTQGERIKIQAQRIKYLIDRLDV